MFGSAAYREGRMGRSIDREDPQPHLMEDHEWADSAVCTSSVRATNGCHSCIQIVITERRNADRWIPPASRLYCRCGRLGGASWLHFEEVQEEWKVYHPNMLKWRIFVIIRCSYLKWRIVVISCSYLKWRIAVIIRCSRLAVHSWQAVVVAGSLERGSVKTLTRLIPTADLQRRESACGGR